MRNFAFKLTYAALPGLGIACIHSLTKSLGDQDGILYWLLVLNLLVAIVCLGFLGRACLRLEQRVMELEKGFNSSKE